MFATAAKRSKAGFVCRQSGQGRNFGRGFRNAAKHLRRAEYDRVKTMTIVFLYAICHGCVLLSSIMKKLDSQRSELAAALWTAREGLYAVGLFSCILNFLMLTPAIYMMQVYDRVLSSRSEVTLLMLTLLILVLYALMAGMEWVRSQLLNRLGMRLDEVLHDRVFDASFASTLRQGGGGNANQALQDLASLRQFLAGQGLLAFIDAPWSLIFLVVAFLMHPLLGLITLGGSILLFIMTYATEMLTQKPLTEASQAWAKTTNFATSSFRNAEVIAAMGMLDNVRQHWMDRYRKVLGLQALASNRGGSISAGTRFLRLSLQSLILGAGALLAIDGLVSPGVMIAASIVMGRAMAPVEIGIAHWKGFVAARIAYNRLSKLLELYPEKSSGMPLPSPRGDLLVDNVVVAAPGCNTPILRGVSMSVSPGEAIAIIGPSAAGKSTLARTLIGLWPSISGKVRLDGADLFEWNKQELGPCIGYLPQDVELFGGTIAENIARCGIPNSEQVIEASRQAGLHELILRFPQGYDTEIGEGGGFLSAGQRQRIGLARALYGGPVLVVLDEPNSNLDDAGEAALVSAVLSLKAANKTVVVVTHRTNVVSAVDKILVLRDGQVAGFGARDEILAAMRGAPPATGGASSGNAVPIIASN